MLTRHETHIFALEISEAIFCSRQSLLVLVDLCLQKRLCLARIRALRAERLFDEGIYERIDDRDGLRSIHIPVCDRVDIVDRSVNSYVVSKLGQEILELLVGPGPEIEIRGPCHLGQIGPADDFACDDEDFVENILGATHFGQKPAQRILGVHVDAGPSFVHGRQQVDSRPADEADQPDGQHGAPPETPHAAGIGFQPVQRVADDLFASSRRREGTRIVCVGSHENSRIWTRG